jgi:PPOX class probable FMN-dependent enzyme
MQSECKEIVKTEERFREVMGHPAERVVAKVISALDEHCRAFIARSPFVLIASSDASGNVDVSPKGDPPGFVQVLDDETLAIPDRLGNRRADTFRNILQNPKVGLLFMIPGKEETLRVSGTAIIVRDDWLRERMPIRGKAPDFAIVVKVEEAFAHCAKSMIRSKLWETDHWPDLDGLPSIARMMVDHGKLPMSVEEMQALADDSYRSKLY